MLSEQIKKLRKEKKLSLEQLADLIGTSRQTIHRYENGTITNIPREKIESLAKALGTTPAILMGWEDANEDISTFNNICIMPVSINRLPVLGSVSCGKPIYAEQQYESYVAADSAVKADFCLRAQGDSMINARIFDGDLLFVQRQDTVNNGDIAVVLIEDEATVKRIYYDRDENILTLMPENPTYKPMRYMGTALSQIRILGKVIAGNYNIE